MELIDQLRVHTIEFILGFSKADEIWYPSLDTESMVIQDDLVKLNENNFITFESQPASENNYGYLKLIILPFVNGIYPKNRLSSLVKSIEGTNIILAVTNFQTDTVTAYGLTKDEESKLDLNGNYPSGWSKGASEVASDATAFFGSASDVEWKPFYGYSVILQHL